MGDVTQDSRITGTSDGRGSDQGLTTGGSGTGVTGQDTGTGTQQLSALETQQRVELARLRAQVAGLEQQLAQMRVQLARTQQAQGTGGSGQDTGTGTGGSGQDTGTGGGGQGTGAAASSTIGDPNAEAPNGATGIGYSNSTIGYSNSTAEGVGGGGATGSTANTGNEGVAVAHVIHRGRVRSVTQQQLVLDEEDGGTSTLSLARDVRVTQGRQQVALRNLGEGTLVRTSADLYARGNPVTSIEVLSVPKAPKK
ncbi:putative lipoprotein [Archangium gephyra]|uniref:Lipoprotein n=1 Tax=Archangium gephyra TaxID=48 RepID=A0AAC8PZY5_9BACT|nr:putative lipoprotein [Archangium gephyra]